MNKVYLIGAGLFILGLLAGVFFNGMNSRGSVIGKTIEGLEYTKTVAVCNADKECIDVSVECKNGEIQSIKPVSDLKDFSDIENWTNPSDERFKLLCK